MKHTPKAPQESDYPVGTIIICEASPATVTLVRTPSGWKTKGSDTDFLPSDWETVQWHLNPNSSHPKDRKLTVIK